MKAISISAIIFVIFSHTQAQWDRLNVPGSGRVTSFACNNGKLFAGTYRGLYCKQDSSHFWEPVKISGSLNGTNAPIPTSGYIDAVYSNGEKILFSSTALGLIYYSQDFGKSWLISTATNYLGITSLTSIGNKLFASAFVNMYGGGIYLSNDNGLTWSSSGLTGISASSLLPLGSYLLAGTDNGIYISHDEGASWSQSNISSRIRKLTYTGSILLAYTDNSIYKSADTGKSWVSTSAELDGLGITSACGIGNVLFAGTIKKGVLRSTDSGSTWLPVNDVILDTAVTMLSVNGSHIFAGTDNSGLFESPDSGKTWSRNDSGMTSVVVNGLAVDGQTIFANTDLNDVCSSLDYGVTWTKLPGKSLSNEEEQQSYPPAMTSNISIAGDKVIIACGPLYVGSINASAWSRVESSGNLISDGTGKSYFFNAGFELLAQNKNCLFAASPNGVIHRSCDKGATWIYGKADSLFGVSCSECRDIKAIAANEQYLFAAVSNGIFRSGDGGTTWVKIDLSISNLITIVAMDSVVLTSGQENGGIYRSDNNGASWVKSDSGLPFTTYTSHSISRNTYPIVRNFTCLNQLIFAQTDSAVYLSKDNGKSWKSVTSDLSGITLSSIAVSQTHLFIGTKSWGILRRPLSDLATYTVSGRKHSGSKSIINFTKNRIELSLPSFSDATVKIFDLKGRLIANKSFDQLESGRHVFQLQQYLNCSGSFLADVTVGGSRYIQKFSYAGK
jgi:photosystem II stability/assembly factor-like uncharacterized protein